MKDAQFYGKKQCGAGPKSREKKCSATWREVGCCGHGRHFENDLTAHLNSYWMCRSQAESDARVSESHERCTNCSRLAHPPTWRCGRALRNMFGYLPPAAHPLSTALCGSGLVYACVYWGNY